MRSTKPAPGFASVPEVVRAIGRGEMVVVVDAPDRENEGDLVMAAEFVTPEAVNFMATHGRGLVCVPMLRDRLDALGIPPMTATPDDAKRTAFHVGVDHRAASTGIAASERATAIAALADPRSTAAELVCPGHVFPLAYCPGGVLRRAGHTEASVDLAILAGVSPAAVICEISAASGEMARVPELLDFAAEHGLLVLAISDLIAFRRAHPDLVVRRSAARLPLDQGEFRVMTYSDETDGRQHLALVLGDLQGEVPLVRVHSECLTGDVFGSLRCDCGRQLERAIDMIAAEGRGAIVYLRGHEGRGIGLIDKIHAYALQDDGLDTVQANLELGLPVDQRDYGVGAQILRDLGVERLRLLTNNPAKRAGLEDHGLEVVDRVPVVAASHAESVTYLEAKRTKLGHFLEVPAAMAPAG